MLSKIIIKQVIDSQKERLILMDSGLLRNITGFSNLSSHTLIVSGIRRCGKSTLLQQIHKTFNDSSIYLNFEDPRLAGFDLSDFNRLQEIAVQENTTAYFFDEIQNIDNWESFVRFRLDEGYRIFITGSNASMLSKELGTKLTGRHITKELFPFSYSEFLSFTNQESCALSSGQYMKSGGFPEYLKTGLPEVLMYAFSDIVVRDIAVRYNLKNTSVLQQLAVWLVSNTGKPITGNSLRKIFEIGSSSSMMDYLSYFVDAYLFFFIPKFSYSRKVQLVNPKKVYCIDNGFIEINSVSFNEDNGRLLENMVYLQLRRKTPEIYYFKEKKECDFVVFQQGKIRGLYQVCWQLDQNNMDRELSGLVEAMNFFGLKTAGIITNDQSDSFVTDDKTIKVQPFHEWAVT
ncbi:MAG: ATP-binding protein [Chitinophagaceae bacterium]|nr:ATP-binding protein [Chitinophagaceae bacterium]